jgi:hypothetical protein
MQRDQSAFPGVTGEEEKAGTSFASEALHAAQGGSIFNKRRDQDGYFINDKILKLWVLPFLVKGINAEHELHASYSGAELDKLDEAIAEFHAGAHVNSRPLCSVLLYVLCVCPCAGSLALPSEQGRRGIAGGTTGMSLKSFAEDTFTGTRRTSRSDCASDRKHCLRTFVTKTASRTA